MSTFFNTLYLSFIGWFQTLVYWDHQSTHSQQNKTSHLNYFFFKKKIINSNQLWFVMFWVNIFYKFNFFKSLYILFSSGFLGLKSFWNHFRFWLISLTLSVVIFLTILSAKSLPFNKVIFLWTAAFMIFYWLVSGFVFFVKKYQFGKYTSAIQRFWKRSYILFWLLETCLLLVFVYLTFTASQESFYMFDQIQIYKTHLFSWRLFIIKNLPIIIVISVTYFLLLTLKWNTFSKHSTWLLIITFLLTYVIWIEFYQFYHIVNFYGNLNWIFDFDDKVWNLELEARRTRIVNNYVMFLLILRFWHLIFVYIFWLFFVLRGCEIKRLRYPLLAANFQNLLILYIMNWITMYPWFKLTFRKYLNQPYVVFNVNNRYVFSRVFFNDIKLFLLNAFENHLFIFKNYFKKNFFYFIEWNELFLTQHIRKHFINNNLITELKSNRVASASFDNFFKNTLLTWTMFFDTFEVFLNFINLTTFIEVSKGSTNLLYGILGFFKNCIIFSVSLINSFFGFLN